MKNNLFGQTLTELSDICRERKLPAFTGKQIAQWLYQQHVDSIGEMTNLSLKNRAILAEDFDIRKKSPTLVRTSTDGTEKCLFSFETGDIETAVIPDKERKTVCLSTQAGCRMGCSFCVTGTIGFHGNLTPFEIINQVEMLQDRDSVTNIVIMGMGEPLDNYDNVMKALEIFTSSWGFGISPHKITLSTIGVKTYLEQFIKESNVNLAISLHSPYPGERAEIVPGENSFPTKDIIQLLKENPFPRSRKLTFEYSLLKGINDSAKHARATAALLEGIDTKINLIPVNVSERTPFQPSNEKTILTFQKILKGYDIMTTVRKSKGKDINAACGLLSATENKV